MGDTPTVRWGLVGTTGYAASTALPALRTARGASVISVLSADARRAKAFAAREGLPRGFGDLDEFLDDPETDAVWILTASLAPPAHRPPRRRVAVSYGLSGAPGRGGDGPRHRTGLQGA